MKNQNLRIKYQPRTRWSDKAAIKKTLTDVETIKLTPHRCHWPECDVTDVPPGKYMCKKHWFTLPVSLREQIWKAYRPRQEIDGCVSKEYREVVTDMLIWIGEHLAHQRRRGRA